MNNTAQIFNLELVRTASERLAGRTSGLPGIGCLYGPAGWGKTCASLSIANERRAYFVQLRSAWSRKAMLEAILREMGIAPAGTLCMLLDQIAVQLSASGRMLILDEFDHAAKNASMVELVRDIYEASQGTLLLVGEEMLPKKLQRYERFHSRVLTWVPAQPVTLSDARLLAPIYAPRVRIDDAMLEHLVQIAKGSVRRVSVNLASIAEEAAIDGLGEMTLSAWGDRRFYTGDAPVRDLRGV